MFSISTDLNECQENTHDCDNNATCTNMEGSFNCTCNNGYSGDGKSCDGKCITSTLLLFCFCGSISLNSSLFILPIFSLLNTGLCLYMYFNSCLTKKYMHAETPRLADKTIVFS